MKKSIAVFIFAVCLLAGLSETSAQTILQTKEVVFGELKPYTHSTKRFSIDVPVNWKVEDTSTGVDDLIINISDPTENGSFVLRVYNPGSETTEDERKEMLKSFLNDAGSSFPKFKMDKAESQSNGSIKISFTFDADVDGMFYPMICDSFMFQKGTYVAILSYVIPVEQYNKNKASANKIIDSLRLN